MTEPSGHRQPMPMEGHGGYDRNSRVQAAGLLPAVALLRQAAREVPLGSAAEPLLIADYGSASGRNSLLPMAAAVRALRERAGPEREIGVVHTDLPGNDFTALFQTLDSDPESYLKGDPAVFASAVGRSFYGQVLPAASVTLGWSSWAVQWLSRIPAEIPDQVQVGLSRDAAARAAFARQAALDWAEFLAHRARELRQGGRLVILAMATDDTGAFGYRLLLEALQDTLDAMVAEGRVSALEVQRMAVATVGRTRAELEAPFRTGAVPGLALSDLDIFPAEDRIWAQFEADGDAAGFGARWAAFSRASVFPTLASALENGAEGPGFMDALEAGTAARLARAPGPTLIPLARMVVTRA